MEIVKQLFFIDASGSVSQQNVSLLAPQTDSNVNNTGNRATVSSFLVSPHLRHSFGQDALGEARFSYSTVTTSSVAGGSAVAGASAVNSQNKRIDLRLNSGPAFKLYTWNVAYSRNTVDYSQAQQPDVTTETISAGGRRLITSQFGLNSTVAYEKSNYSAAGRSPSGASWNAGADWTPTPRTRLAATAGRRYFGSTKSLDFSHRTRLTTWGANYSESVTNTHGQALVPSSASTAGYLDTLFLSSIPDPVVRQVAVQSFIAQNALPASLTVPVNFLTTQTTLVKRMNASFGINGLRNTVLTNLFTSTSASLAAGVPVTGAGDFASSSTVKQNGGSVLWNWRIATHVSSNASASYTRSEFPSTGQKNDIQSVRLGLTQQFQPRLSGSLNYRSQHTKSNLAGGSFDENAISAALSLRY